MKSKWIHCKFTMCTVYRTNTTSITQDATYYITERKHIHYCTTLAGTTLSLTSSELAVEVSLSSVSA